jgi:hypothetical protein
MGASKGFYLVQELKTGVNGLSQVCKKKTIVVWWRINHQSFSNFQIAEFSN